GKGSTIPPPKKPLGRLTGRRTAGERRCVSGVEEAGQRGDLAVAHLEQVEDIGIPYLPALRAERATPVDHRPRRVDDAAMLAESDHREGIEHALQRRDLLGPVFRG